MEFSGVSLDTSKNVFETIKYILGLNISLDDKRSRVIKVLRLVGTSFHTKMFDDNSRIFDSTALKTIGVDDSSQSARLATKLIRNYSLGRSSDPLVGSYFDTLLGQAQMEAFENAVSMQKVPTLTRSLVGEVGKWCWCPDLAGTYTNPRPDMFKRHTKCDCLFTVSGYNTRNGILNNYRKS